MEISNCVNKNVAIEKINAVQPKLNAVVTMVVTTAFNFG